MTSTRQTVDKALKANKDHQYALKVYTERLEAELASVDKLISAAESFDDSSDESLGIFRAPGAKKPVSLVPLSGFLSEDSPFYEDATWRKTYEERTTINPMKAKDHDILAEAVRMENKRLYALNAQKRGEPVINKLPDYPPEYWEQNTEGLDWKKIASKFSSISALPSRTPDELRIRWLGHAHPKFSHGPWTPEETERVKQIVSEMCGGGAGTTGVLSSGSKSKVDWVKVAEALGTNRTPLDCMRHSTSRRSHIWTPESDKRLLEAVNMHGGNNWSLVALTVSPDATAHACQKRYMDTLDPTLKRGPWSADEDTRLLKAIAGFWQPGTAAIGSSLSRNGSMETEETETVVDDETSTAGPSSQQEPPSKSRAGTKTKTASVPIPWPDVAAFVPGRNNNQCRERYNVLISSASKGKEKAIAQPKVVENAANAPLKQNINRSRWTKDEDERLVRAVQELGEGSDKSKWIEVAGQVGNGRGWAVCKRRYEKIKLPQAPSIPSTSHPASFRVNIDTSSTSQAPEPAPEMPNVREPVMVTQKELRFVQATLGEPSISRASDVSTHAEMPQESAMTKERSNAGIHDGERVLPTKGKGKGKGRASKNLEAEVSEPPVSGTPAKIGKLRSTASTSDGKASSKSKPTSPKKSSASRRQRRHPQPDHGFNGVDDEEIAETEVEVDEDDGVEEVEEAEEEVEPAGPRSRRITTKTPAAKKRKRALSRTEQDNPQENDGERITPRKRQKTTRLSTFTAAPKQSTTKTGRKGRRSSQIDIPGNENTTDVPDKPADSSTSGPPDASEDQAGTGGTGKGALRNDNAATNMTAVNTDTGRRRSTRIALKK